MDYEVFLDTSIQIERVIGNVDSKAAVRKFLEGCHGCVTSLVVKQEFKRRLLKDAAYLLTLVSRYEDLGRVQQHVVDALSKYQHRKLAISVKLLAGFFPGDSMEDAVLRAKDLLRQLIMTGLEEWFGSDVRMLEESGCSCARQGPVERREFIDYRFGSDRCTAQNACGIRAFLGARVELLRGIVSQINEQREEHITVELREARRFAVQCINGLGDVKGENPCLRHGDLIISLESERVRAFFTKNHRESIVLCRAVGQDLVVLRAGVDAASVLLLSSQEEGWRESLASH